MSGLLTTNDTAKPRWPGALRTSPAWVRRYVLHPGFQGHGYATEAAHAVLSLGFEVLGLHRIVARIDEGNETSAGIARRLGMRQESRLVHNEVFKGG
jgi:RimJ/RimL family protein N-acetyltransferase